MKDSVYADMKESEKQVAEYLRELDLWWWYEYPVFVYDEKKRPRVWTPDFYIPNLGMLRFIEGISNPIYSYEQDKNGERAVAAFISRKDPSADGLAKKMVDQIVKAIFKGSKGETNT